MPPSPFRPGGPPRISGPGRSPLSYDTTPRVEAVTPNSDRIAGGASVTITGRNFAYTDGVGTLPIVLFGSVPAVNVVVVSDTEITCDAPAQTEPALVDISVTNFAGQTGTLEDCFSYVKAFIEAIEPNHGPLSGGTQVTIIGGNFLPGSTILFDGVAATGVTFLDAQHYTCITPNHAVGPVTVTLDGEESPFPFFYTLLTRGEDIRRNPSISISEHLGNAPNTCSFTVDGQSSPPKEGSVIEITDSLDGDRLLFGGIVQSVEQIYEDQTTQLAWNVRCSDYTFWLNRRRPFGTYLNTSASSVVLDMVARFAPWVDTSFVQTSLCNVNISFDGSQDFASCLSMLARLLGAGYWYIDYERRLHFFHTVAPASGFTGATTQNPSGVVESGSGNPGIGAAMTATLTSTVEASGRADTLRVFRTTFVYKAIDPFVTEKIETALGPLSNMVKVSGGRLVQLSNIPIAPALTGYTARRRIYYYEYHTGGGYNSLTQGLEIADNTTTSILFSSEPSFNPGVDIDLFLGVPDEPVIAPPAGSSTAPSASNGGQSQGRFLVNEWGRSTDYYSSDSQPLTSGGFYTFKVSNVYEDGTESLPSPPSNTIENDGVKTIILNVPVGLPINGVPVIYRKVYRAYQQTEFARANTIGWWAIPDNTTTVVETAAGMGFRYGTGLTPPNSGAGLGQTNTLDPCDGDGPYLEDSLAQPGDIDDNNVDLLRETPLTSTIDVSQVRNRVFVRGGGTSTVTDASAGSLTLSVADSSALPSAGIVLVGQQGRTLKIVDTAPTVGGATLRLGEPLVEDLPSGTPIRSVVAVNDLQSQKMMGRIEVDDNGNPTDGVHEYFIDDSSLKTYQQQLSRAYAELEMFSKPVVTVRYSTRDPNTHPGRKVTINLSNPPLKGEFLIQSVQVDQVHDESDVLMPRYTAEASSVKFTLEDLLLMIAAQVNPKFSPGTGDQVGLSPAGLVESAVGESVTFIEENINNFFTGFAQVYTFRRSFSMGELSSLASSPLEILGPPGGGKAYVMIDPLKHITVVTTGFSPGINVSVRYKGSSPLTNMVSAFTLLQVATGTFYGTRSAQLFNNSTADIYNKGLELVGSANVGTGVFTKCIVQFEYMIFDTNE